MVKTQFQKNIFSVFYTKVGYSFRSFNLYRELIPNCWGSHRESTFANIQLSFRNKKFENGLSKDPRDMREM